MQKALWIPDKSIDCPFNPFGFCEFIAQTWRHYVYMSVGWPERRTQCWPAGEAGSENEGEKEDDFMGV